MRDSVSFDVTFGYWTAYAAEIQLFLRSPGQLAISSVIPLGGLFILYTIVAHHEKLAAGEILLELLVVLLCVFFTPLGLAFTLWMNRRNNPHNRGPFRYSLDRSGVRARSETVESTVKWPAIRRIVETKRFLFLRIASGGAISLPIAQLEAAGVLADVREIVRKSHCVPRD